MSDVINLRQKRKDKARSDKEKNAAANRAKFGQTKEQKQLAKLKAEKAQRHIDSHKMDKDEQ